MKLHLVLALLLVVASAGCHTAGKVDIWRVVTDGRDGWQRPDEVVAALALEPGDRVAEIGAGDGYWLPWFAEAVGSEGRVYAVEVTDELVAQLEERVRHDGLSNVIVVRGEFHDPQLPDGGIDVAVTSLTYHHIEGRPIYFRQLQTDLSPGGRVVHIDDRPDAPAPFSWFQSDGHWTDPEEMRAEMSEAGYHPVESFDFLPVQSFQIFEPIVPATAATEAP
jgi:arsenite methyltransferase